MVTDEILVRNISQSSAMKSLKLAHTKQSTEHLHGLQIQGASARSIADSVPKENTNIWSATIETTSTSLHNFARKALLQVLPTASNLFRWGRLSDPSCPLCACGNAQTNKHVLSNCSSATALRRYTSPHDGVLGLLLSWLRSVVPESCAIYTDLGSVSGTLPVCDLFINYRPDIAVMKGKEFHTWELTVCPETNMVKSREYKENKYRLLDKATTSQSGGRKTFTHTIEVSTLGFVSNMLDFTKSLKLALPITLKKSIILTVLKSSFKIYCERNQSTNITSVI